MIKYYFWDNPFFLTSCLIRLPVGNSEKHSKWSWVQCKKNQRWLWWVIDKKTGEVLGFTFGRRTNETWKLPLEDLKEVLAKYDVSYEILYTDGHHPIKFGFLRHCT